MLSQQIVETLTEERKRQGLTQRELSERMDCALSFVQMFEYRTRDPRLSTVERYAKALGVVTWEDFAGIRK